MIKKQYNIINSINLHLFLFNWINSNSNVVPFIHGQAGIGKTAIVEELAKDKNIKLVILNLAHQEEGDLIGIPYREDGVMIYTKPEWLASNEDEEVILFLDEIDRAQKNILNMSLSIIREYRINQHFIPKKWKIIAAGNSGINDDFYDTNEMDFALKSRFIHLFYELTAKEWLNWARKNNINPLIIKYIEMKPQDLIFEPKDSFDIFSYPNPRTWEILSRGLEFTDEKIWKFIIIGAIGKEIGESFYSFIKTIDIQELPMIFDNFINNKEAFIKLKKLKKEILVNTIINMNNNVDFISKNYKKEILINTFSKIIGMLIHLDYFELAVMLFRSIEENNNRVSISIIDNMNKSENLKPLLETFQNKIKLLKD